MSRFAELLGRTAARLDIPQPARSRVLLELAGDLDALYEHYRGLGLEEDEASRRVAERSKDAPPESDSRQDQCGCAAPLSDAFVSAGIFGDPMILLFMIS